MGKSMVVNRELGFIYPRMARRMAIINQELEGDILDVGCGDGTLSGMLRPPANYLGIEPSKEMIKTCRKRGLNVIWGNIYSLHKSLGGRKFDTVLCLEAMPHFMNLSIALENLKAAVKNGGKLIISVENIYAISRVLREVEWDPADYHYVAFDEPRMRFLLADNGFRVEKVYYVPNFTPRKFYKINFLLSGLFTFISKRFCDNFVFVCRLK